MKSEELAEAGVTRMKLSSYIHPTNCSRKSKVRRQQQLTGGGHGRWKQQGPGREWQSVHCCSVACNKK